MAYASGVNHLNASMYGAVPHSDSTVMQHTVSGVKPVTIDTGVKEPIVNTWYKFTKRRYDLTWYKMTWVQFYWIPF